MPRKLKTPLPIYMEKTAVNPLAQMIRGALDRGGRYGMQALSGLGTGVGAVWRNSWRPGLSIGIPAAAGLTADLAGAPRPDFLGNYPLPYTQLGAGLGGLHAARNPLRSAGSAIYNFGATPTATSLAAGAPTSRGRTALSALDAFARPILGGAGLDYFASQPQNQFQDILGLEQAHKYVLRPIQQFTSQHVPYVGSMPFTTLGAIRGARNALLPHMSPGWTRGTNIATSLGAIPAAAGTAYAFPLLTGIQGYNQGVGDRAHIRNETNQQALAARDAENRATAAGQQVGNLTNTLSQIRMQALTDPNDRAADAATRTPGDEAIRGGSGGGISGFLGGLPNWGKGLLYGGGALGAGLLADSMLSGEEEDENGKPRKTNKWLGPAVGLGAGALGAGLLTNWDYRKLGDPNFWKSSSAELKVNKKPLVVIPYQIKLSAFPEQPFMQEPPISPLRIPTPPTLDTLEEHLNPRPRPPAGEPPIIHQQGASPTPPAIPPTPPVPGSSTTPPTGEQPTSRSPSSFNYNTLFNPNAIPSNLRQYAYSQENARSQGMQAASAMGGGLPGFVGAAMQQPGSSMHPGYMANALLAGATGSTQGLNTFRGFDPATKQYARDVVRTGDPEAARPFAESIQHQPPVDVEEGAGDFGSRMLQSASRVGIPGVRTVPSGAISRINAAIMQNKEYATHEDVQMNNKFNQLRAADPTANPQNLWDKVKVWWSQSSLTEKLLVGLGLSAGAVGLFNMISGKGGTGSMLLGLGGLGAAAAGMFGLPSFLGNWTQNLGLGLGGRLLTGNYQGAGTTPRPPTLSQRNETSITPTYINQLSQRVSELVNANTPDARRQELQQGINFELAGHNEGARNAVLGAFHGDQQIQNVLTQLYGHAGQFRTTVLPQLREQWMRQHMPEGIQGGGGGGAAQQANPGTNPQAGGSPPQQSTGPPPQQVLAGMRTDPYVSRFMTIDQGGNVSFTGDQLGQLGALENGPPAALAEFTNRLGALPPNVRQHLQSELLSQAGSFMTPDQKAAVNRMFSQGGQGGTTPTNPSVGAGQAPVDISNLAQQFASGNLSPQTSQQLGALPFDRAINLSHRALSEAEDSIAVNGRTSDVTHQGLQAASSAYANISRHRADLANNIVFNLINNPTAPVPHGLDAATQGALITTIDTIRNNANNSVFVNRLVGQGVQFNPQTLPRLEQLRQALSTSRIQAVVDNHMSPSNVLALRDILLDRTVDPYRRVEILSTMDDTQRQALTRAFEVQNQRMEQDRGTVSHIDFLNNFNSTDVNTRNSARASLTRVLTSNFQHDWDPRTGNPQFMALRTAAETMLSPEAAEVNPNVSQNFTQALQNVGIALPGTANNQQLALFAKELLDTQLRPTEQHEPSSAVNYLSALYGDGPRPSAFDSRGYFFGNIDESTYRALASPFTTNEIGGQPYYSGRTIARIPANLLPRVSDNLLPAESGGTHNFGPESYTMDQDISSFYHTASRLRRLPNPNLIQLHRWLLNQRSGRSDMSLQNPNPQGTWGQGRRPVDSSVEQPGSNWNVYRDIVAGEMQRRRLTLPRRPQPPNPPSPPRPGETELSRWDFHQFPQ